jgi:5-formyltetrahydrofolate cyclo-ligase
MEHETAEQQSKAALRTVLSQKIAALSQEQARRQARQLQERVLTLPEVRRARGVLACLSFGTEIDTWSLVEALLAAGKKVYVPRTVPATRGLALHPYPCALRRLSFGLAEPLASEPQLPAEAVNEAVEVALVLGLAFDGRGIRLGHGAGYFDRFLVGRPFVSIGLGYDEQWLPRLPAEAHDVPMTVVLTPSREQRLAR